MKSLSEIDTVSKRASRAAGYTWGIAEEVGKNIRLLEFFSLPGIKNLNAFLNNKKNIKLENLSLITEDNSANNSQYCPVIAGVNFLDQIKTLENLSEINFKNIAYPILFLPFVSRASEIVGKRILLKLDEKEFLMNFKNEDSFTENEWKELYKLSEETFVEENESLKNSGAGAGLTDND